tara:strand:+ start:3528 stop:4181 length:654 start_codon:yes stop_codon:yes gene_type:complete
MKVLVCIPAYDRKLSVETACSLLKEQGAATLAGVDMHVIVAPGSSLITQARNQLASEFLASDADRMVFIDADVAWEVGSLLKIASHKVDFCGGAYRYKSDDEGYPVGWLEGTELWADPDTGLLEVGMLPGGFLSLSRAVFKELTEAHTDRAYAFHGKQFQAFFHCPPGDGEDGAFCRDWRDLGGKVWLDPELTLTHVEGGRSYTGHIGNWLKNRPAS